MSLIPLVGGRVFVFKDTREQPPHMFRCELQGEQCQGRTKAGARCRRRTVKYLPKCFQHLKSEDGLVVKPSGIAGAGDGLWTTRARKRDEKIVRYTGEVLNDAQLQERYPGDSTAPYVVQQKRGRYVDAACERGTSAYVNHKSYTQSNCRWLVNQAGQVWIVAKQNIPADTELFVSYGSDYRLHEQGVSHTTK